MKSLTLGLVLLCLSASAFAQLQPDQKLTDFETLVALFNKQYAPYDWKRDVLHYDMLDIAPWIAKVNATKDDVGFYEVCAAYVASLNDAHSQFFVDTDFTADLGFQADLYDGKPLIDFIDSGVARTVNFKVGDELISVDGVTVADWLKEFARYSAYANQRSTDRFNTQSITFRQQTTYPRAAEIGDTAVVVVLRAGSANPQTYTMTWNKSGLPISSVGPVPSPHASGFVHRPVKPSTPVKPVYPSRPHSKSLLSLENNRVPIQRAVRGFDMLSPVFLASFPSSFVRRLGKGGDFFFSGTFTAGGKKIGYLRIPDFLDSSTSNAADFALSEFEQEVTYMQNNTDAMVVDVMRNPGGLGCYAEALLQDLVPYRFRGIGQQIRVTQDWLLGISEEIDQSSLFGFDQTTVSQLNALFTSLKTAYAANRGLTDPVPLCATYFERDPAINSKGDNIAYSKPLLLLTDEFTTSAAEIFASEFQDSQRGPMFGWRTAGAGGTVNGPYFSGYYSEGLADITQSILIRTNHVVTPDFPVTDMIENVGVRPDITLDYMTEENLTNHGKTFVDGFTAAVLALVK
jgi:C-terminal processing protease CtpA/Prc